MEQKFVCQVLRQKYIWLNNDSDAQEEKDNTNGNLQMQDNEKRMSLKQRKFTPSPKYFEIK